MCTSLIVANSWNVPACSASAIISVPGLTTVLIGSYIWNPTYGWFRVTAFDSVNAQLTVFNECLDGNATPGSVVPAGTQFVFGSPPASTNVTFSGMSAGTNYTLTNATAPFVFGTTQTAITLTSPGTYLLLSQATIETSAIVNAAAVAVRYSLNRTNNTPAQIISDVNMQGIDINGAAYTSIQGPQNLPPLIYTTLNSNDNINMYGYYVGVISSGNIQISKASIVAVKLY